MSQLSTDALDPEIEQQTRLVRGLMAALFAHNQTDTDESLLQELTAAKKTLRELQLRRDAERAEAEKAQAGPKRTMGVPLVRHRKASGSKASGSDRFRIFCQGIGVRPILSQGIGVRPI